MDISESGVGRYYTPDFIPLDHYLTLLYENSENAEALVATALELSKPLPIMIQYMSEVAITPFKHILHHAHRIKKV